MKGIKGMKENKQASKDYRENLKKKALNGDIKAQKQKKKKKYNRYRSAAKSFILTKIKYEDIGLFRDYLAERAKALRTEKTSKKS